MTLTAKIRAFSTFAQRKRLLSAVIAGTALLLAFLGVQVSYRIDILRSAPQDNAQWAMAQIDVELLALAVALRDADSGQPDKLAEVRKRFDIFYGRVAAMRSLPAFYHDPGQAEVRSRLTLIQSHLDAMAGEMTRADDQMLKALPGLLSKADVLRPLARQISLDGVQFYSRQSDTARNELVDLFRLTAATDIILIGLLLSALLLLARQFRISRSNAAALQAESERSANTIKASFDPIIVTDFNGKIVEFNPAATRTFGLPEHDALGADMANLIIPGHLRDAWRKKLGHFRDHGNNSPLNEGPIEMMAIRRNGTEFPAELSITTSEGSSGNHVIAFLRDITTRREQEKALHQARDDAIETARLKSQFLAVMSHEMRTPLNGVMAVMDLLAETKLTERQREYLHTALTSAEVLKQHVDDVLDLTRVQAGKVELVNSQFDVRSLVEEICRINAPIAATRGNRINSSVELNVATLSGDRKRIHQILTNLVSNAIKFTRGGTITVSARQFADEADRITIEFSVKDTGAGIEPAMHGRIFDEFVTIGQPSSGNPSGSGLGLSICRSLAEAMGGSIGLKSGAGEGSLFFVRIPLQLSRTKTSARKPQAQNGLASKTGTRLQVLLVEDNETNRFVVAEMLRRLNCDVVQAEGGKQGIARANRKRFDLILMDISMPGTSGWDAIRAIRTNANGKSRSAPVYVLTAHVMAEELSAHVDASIQGYLYKPLRLRTLTAVVDRLHTASPPASIVVEKITTGRQDTLDLQVMNDLCELFSRDDVLARLDRYAIETETELQQLALLGGRSRDGERAALAHKLAGSAGVVGASAMREMLLDIEARQSLYRGKKLSARIILLRRSLKDYAQAAKRVVNATPVQSHAGGDTAV